MAVDEPTCGLDAALTVLGGKWKPLILYRLRPGPKRFGDLSSHTDQAVRRHLSRAERRRCWCEKEVPVQCAG